MDFIKEDIVISGIGGFFPKAKNIEEFKAKLFSNEHLMESRWREGERGVSNQIGKITIDYFDNAFFGIHRQQSFFMDPMQRLVLERTFEALIDAGVNPNDIKGRRIGCFMGSSIGENDNLFLESIVSGFGITGHSRAMMPNRVSYWLNLKGPSVAYDSNWVSGLEVIRLAFDAIRTGQCESAIVGTANLALNCEMQWIYDDMGLLSHKGVTKSFDANADGYTRSDGVVVLYIQKESDARRSYASIVNVNTCFNAASTGNILQSNAEKMTEFLTDFYKNSKVKPSEVEFVEAYGCGIKDTDQKEVEALANVYCKDRKEPLLIGSVKSNAGHSESSSNLFSVAKVLIAMETGIIPANINYDEANPEIPALIDGSIEVVTKNRPWNAQYAAINGIGLDSYYGHLLLKANIKNKVELKDDLPRLVLASTRTEEGINSILETIKSKPRDNLEYYQLLQDLFAKPILGHLYRGYAVLGCEEEKQESEYHLGNKRQLWFVYSGMGSQWCGMVGDLMKIPIFAKAINKCADILKPKGIDLLNVISSKDKTTYDSILNSFVGIAAIQIGLTDVLHSIGLVPDGIIGHSVGELGCAYADGCLTAEQMILAAYCRGRASLEASLIKGMMAAVGMGYQQIKDKVPPSIEVACHNGPDSSTISGPTEDMEKFVKELQDEGIFARLVNVSNIAYHSKYIRPAAPLLLNYLKEVIPKPTQRSSKWITTSNVEENWNTDLAKSSSAEYHTNNLLSSVLFEEGLKHIPKDSILIEIAPHGLLQAILKRSVKTGSTNIPLTSRGCKSSVEFLLGNMGKMFLAGLDLNVSAIYPKIKYPVSRGTSTLSDLVHWNHTDTWRTGLEGKQINNLFGLRDIQVSLNSEEFRECVGHQFDDKIILPTSYYLNIVFDIFSNVHVGQKQMIFENIYIRNVLEIPKIGSVPFHVMVQKGSGEFEVISNNDLLMSGKITIPEPTDKFILDPIKVEVKKNNVELSGSDVYSELLHRGHKYSGLFKTIKSVVIAEEGSISLVQWNLKWHLLIEAMIQQALVQAGERKQEGHAPKTIQKIAISQTLLPEEKTDLEVSYNFSTNTISTEGIQIIGLKTTPLSRDFRSNFFDSYELVPSNNVSYSNIENGINTALQITLDNFDDQYVTNIMVTEIECSNPSLVENVKNVLNQCTKLNPNVLLVSDTMQVIVQDAYPLLLILNDVIRPDVVKLLESSHGFLLARTDKSILSYPQIVQISQFSVNNVSYSILRKATTTEPIVVTAKVDTISAKDFTRGSVSWVKELQSAVQVAENKKQSVYLVASVVPTEGFINFLQELRAVPNMNSIRLLFTTDKRSSEFNPQDKINQIIFKQDVYLSIIKDGVVNSYLAVPLKLKSNATTNFNITSDLVKNMTVNYIGINLKDETIVTKQWKKNELGHIDYCGVNSSGNRVMGLAQLDQDTCKLITDPMFTWDIPEVWNLEDGATVPNAYVCAYYALFVKGDLKPGETVLIHAGCSAIGIAAISIANVHRCKIYTTVSNDWQRATLKKIFNCLSDHNILNSNNSNFSPLLLTATAGKGAEVIMNCLSGNLLQSSLSCIADYGRFLQIGKYDMEENNYIGLNVFLRNTTFMHVDFENLFNLPLDVKQEIRNYVIDGLESLCVRPIVRKVVEHQNINEILSSLKKTSNIGKIIIKVNNNIALNKLNVSKPNQFICDARSSYLVHGGSVEYWCDVAEWLVLRGARKIIISSDAKPQQNHINRRLSLLHSYYGAEIIFANSKAHTREGAAELLSEVYFLGPIHGVFILPNKTSPSKTNEVKPVHYIDQALRTTAPKALLVNFIQAAAGFCHLRSEAGFWTFNVQWLKELEFVGAINGLDEILSHKVSNVLIKDDRDNDFKQESSQALFKKLTQLLPSSAEVISEQTKEAPEEPTLIQLTTLGPREMRELIPIFIIPGLNGQSQLEELGRDLMYPAFCAVLPSSEMSIQELAEAFAKKIRNIWPKGPYNIAGISWGGALAIEIAGVLNKEMTTTTHMYLLDAAPNTLQASLKHLGEDQANQEVNLLTRIFNISDMEVIKKLKQSTNWEARVTLAIENSKFNPSDRTALEKGLSILKKRLNDISVYKPNVDLITGKIFLIRPADSSKYDTCGLASYCKTTPIVTLVQGDHISIIKSKETSNYINETFNLV